MRNPKLNHVETPQKVKNAKRKILRNKKQKKNYFSYLTKKRKNDTVRHFIVFFKGIHLGFSFGFIVS